MSCWRASDTGRLTKWELARKGSGRVAGFSNLNHRARVSSDACGPESKSMLANDSGDGLRLGREADTHNVPGSAGSPCFCVCVNARM